MPQEQIREQYEKLNLTRIETAKKKKITYKIRKLFITVEL